MTDVEFHKYINELNPSFVSYQLQDIPIYSSEVNLEHDGYFITYRFDTLKQQWVFTSAINLGQ